MCAIHFGSKMTLSLKYKGKLRDNGEIVQTCHCREKQFVLLCGVTKNYFTWHEKSGLTAGGELLAIFISAVWYGSPCVPGGLHTQLCFGI